MTSSKDPSGNGSAPARAAPPPRRVATSRARARAALGGQVSVAAMRGGNRGASARTSPPPVSMSSADASLRQAPTEEPGVAPGWALFGGPAVEPAESPSGRVRRHRLGDEIGERGHGPHGPHGPHDQPLSGPVPTSRAGAVPGPGSSGPGTVGRRIDMRAPPPGSFSATMVPALGLDDLGHDGQPEARAGQAAGRPGTGRSGRRRGAGRPGRCPGRGRAPRPRRRGTPPRRPRRRGSTCGRCRAGCRRPAQAGRRCAATQHGRRESGRTRTSRARPWVVGHGHGVVARAGRAGAAPSRRAAGRPGPARPGRPPGRSAPAAARGRRRPARAGRRRVSSSTRRMTSRLVRRLVSGVRSSCEASSTSWLWARREDSSASSSRLKVRRSRPSSSGPPGREAAGDVGRLGQVLDGVGEGVERHQRGPGHQPAQHDGQERRRPWRPRRARRASLLSCESHVEQRGDLQGAALGEARSAVDWSCSAGRGSTSSRSWFAVHRRRW